MKDPDKFLPRQTVAEIIEKLKVVNLKGGLGFHLTELKPEIQDYLINNLSNRDNFPVQIASGPLCSMRYITSVPSWLVELVNRRAVKLFVHLPFLLTFYKDPKTLGYQRNFIQEFATYYNHLGIDYSVVVHCGHPTDLTVDWKGFFVENMKPFSTLIPHVLIENMAGYFNQPEDYTSPNALYNNFFSEDKLFSNVGLCVDTEHAFGGGHFLTDINSDVWNKVGLIHFNANPRIVYSGSHIDLHSYTRIEQSLTYNSVFSIQGSGVSDWLKIMKKYNIPAVFERRFLETQVDDLLFCQRCSIS